MKQKFLTAALALGLVASPAVNAESNDLEIGGFADVNWVWTSAPTDGNRNNTFSVYDGAVYVSKAFDSGMVFVDIPFFGMGASNSLNFATQKAQAYVQYKYDFGAMWRIGQFDKIMGFESNDTKNIMFARPGIVKTDLLFMTHTGLLAGYDLEAIGIQALVANPVNRGSMGNNIPDFGAKFYFNSDLLRLSAAFLQNQNEGGSANRTYWDFVAGTTWENLKVDLEYLMQNRPNTDAGTGLLANVGYTLNDELSVGIRGEQVTRPANTNNYYKKMALTAGPQINMTKDLKVKLDVTMNSFKVSDGAESDKEAELAVGALYTF